MKILTKEVRDLLDKLYNLRGEDSIILKKMNEERDEAIETKERTKNEKTVLLNEIEKLTQEEKTLAEEGNRLITVLGSINRDDFAFVLDHLNIDFDPSAINEKVSRLLPDTIAKVKEANANSSKKLENVEIEMNNAITKIEELEIRKDEALSNQTKLNDIFALALNGNINITRDEITSLLEKFSFTEDERREAAKILMFPEDGLYAYDDSLKNGILNNYKEEEPEVKEEVTNLEKVEESVQQDSKLEDIFTKIVSENMEPDVINEVDPVIEKDNKDNNETILANLLTSIDLNKEQFKEENYNKLVANFNEDIMKNNIEILKNNKFNLKIVIDNVSILYDKELKEKIDKLLNIGKEIRDINLVPSVLTKYDLNGLNNTINVLQISGLDPKKVPLMAY